MTNLKLIILIVYSASSPVFVLGANNSEKCDKIKCYHSVHKDHDNLLNLVNKFNSSIENFDFNKFNKLNGELNNITTDTKKIRTKTNKIQKKLNQIKKQNDKNQKNITGMFEKLASIPQNISSDGNLHNLIEEIESGYTKLKNLFYLKENTSAVCTLAKENFTKLEETVKSLSKNGANVAKDYSQLQTKSKTINRNLNETFQETIKTKNDLDNLKLPENIIGNYINKTETKLNNSVNVLKENAELLQKALGETRRNFTDVLRENAEDVRKYILTLYKDLEIMNNALKKIQNSIIKYDLEPTVNNKTLQLIQEITQALKDLESRIKSAKLPEQDKNFLIIYDEILQKLEKQILELIRLLQILRIIPSSEEKLTQIEEELKHLRIIVSLIEEKEKLQDQLTQLRQMRDEVLPINCTALASNDTINLT